MIVRGAILFLLVLLVLIIVICFKICKPKTSGSNELQIHKTGDGSTLILLISGLGDGKESYNWNLAKQETKDKLNLHQTKSLQNLITKTFPNTSVVSFDPPGFGDNTQVQVPKSVDEYKDLILRSLDAKPDIVIGHSIGARFAHDFNACKILIDPTPDFLLDTAKNYSKHIENPERKDYALNAKYMEMVSNSLPKLKNLPWTKITILYDNSEAKQDPPKIEFYKSTGVKPTKLIEVQNATHWVHVSHPEKVIEILSKIIAIGSGQHNKTLQDYEIYHSLTYPAASTFVEWLLPKLKKLGIPYKNPNTDGDYYKITIGSKTSKTSKAIEIDWKHLDISEIEVFSKALKPYGYQIKCWDSPEATDYKVILTKLADRSIASVNFIEIYNAVEQDVWHETREFTSEELIDAIRNYIEALVAEPKKHKAFLEEFKKTPKLTNKKVYNPEPGTGKGNSQFYKFARAIYCGELKPDDISIENLKMIIKSNLWDNIE